MTGDVMTIILAITLLCMIAIGFVIAFAFKSHELKSAQNELNTKKQVISRCLFCGKTSVEHEKNYFFDYDGEHFLNLQCMARELKKVQKKK